MLETELTYKGIDLLVKYEYFEGEPTTHEHAGVAERVEVYEVYNGEHNIIELLKQSVIDELENIILNQ